MTTITLNTPQFDARFPNTNQVRRRRRGRAPARTRSSQRRIARTAPGRRQTKACWQNWVDFHKCTEARGAGFPVCQKFQKTFRSLCPNEWVRPRKTLFFSAGDHATPFFMPRRRSPRRAQRGRARPHAHTRTQVEKWETELSEGRSPSF